MNLFREEDFLTLVAPDLSPCDGVVWEASLPSAAPVVLPGSSACMTEGVVGNVGVGVVVRGGPPTRPSSAATPAPSPTLAVPSPCSESAVRCGLVPSAVKAVELWDCALRGVVRPASSS